MIEFENKLIRLKEQFYNGINQQIVDAKDALKYAKRIIQLASPEAILNRGFAIIKHKNKIITNSKQLAIGDEIETYLKDEIIQSTINKKQNNEKRNYL